MRDQWKCYSGYQVQQDVENDSSKQYIHHRSGTDAVIAPRSSSLLSLPAEAGIQPEKRARQVGERYQTPLCSPAHHAVEPASAPQAWSGSPSRAAKILPELKP